jgi:hypothetical protein
MTTKIQGVVRNLGQAVEGIGAGVLVIRWGNDESDA